MTEDGSSEKNWGGEDERCGKSEGEKERMVKEGDAGGMSDNNDGGWQ